MRELYGVWGSNLRARRKMAGLTSTILGADVGVSSAQINRIELGLHAPTDDLRVLLARRLGVRVEELFPYPDTSRPAASVPESRSPAVAS